MKKECLLAIVLLSGCAPAGQMEDPPEQTQNADLISFVSESPESTYLEQEMTFESGDSLHIMTDLKEGSLTVSLLDEELNPVSSEEEISGENDYHISPDPGTYTVSASGDEVAGSFSVEKDHS
ncbi:MAG: hypothetical protein ACI4WR_05485 [Bulleidia sp.]